MFADANIEVPADSRLLENFGMDDIDLETMSQYRRRMAVANPDHVWLGLDNRQLLLKLGGYRVDRRTRKEGLTVAGLLMFGKWSSIRDVDGMPNYGVDIVSILIQVSAGAIVYFQMDPGKVIFFSSFIGFFLGYKM